MGHYNSFFVNKIVLTQDINILPLQTVYNSFYNILNFEKIESFKIVETAQH